MLSLVIARVLTLGNAERDAVYRLVRALWLGLAHTVGALFRGLGRGARGLDPAHRKDGLALLLLGVTLVVAAGTWSNLHGPVGDLVQTLVTGAFGRDRKSVV